MKNCAYASVSTYVFGDVSIYSHLLLRYATSRFINENPSIFSSFIPDIEIFTKTILISGEWASHECLVAMSHLIRRDLLILTDNNEIDYSSDFYDYPLYPKIPLLHENGNHFNVLLPVDGEIKIGFHPEAPINSFLEDPTITLEFLKDVTKFRAEISWPYPSFPVALSKKNLTPSSSSKKTKYIQTVLNFHKSSKDDKNDILRYKFYFYIN